MVRTDGLGNVSEWVQVKIGQVELIQNTFCSIVVQPF